MTAIMRKMSQLSRKAVIAIMKKLSQLSGKLFALGSECFQATGKVISTFTLWILAENGKISLKGILLFLV